MWFRRKSSVPQAPRPAESGVLHVLMVCTGNICRSPTAEGVLRAKLERAGMAQRILVDSAGTHGFHQSEPPDPRAVRFAAQRGYDLSKLRARPVRQADFSRFHWMLAMDEGNLAWLNRHVRSGGGPRIELLAHQEPELGIDEVPDPYYGPDAGFDHVLELIERACDGFLARLVREGAAKRELVQS